MVSDNKEARVEYELINDKVCNLGMVYNFRRLKNLEEKGLITFITHIHVYLHTDTCIDVQNML